LALMTAPSEAQRNKKAIVLYERRARRALGTLDANRGVVSTRAFFKVLTTEQGLNDMAGNWHP
jgi:hypothetical protein